MPALRNGRFVGMLAFSALLCGNQVSRACNASSVDCLVYQGGPVMYSPQIAVYCMGWNCSTATDGLGLVKKVVVGDGVVPTALANWALGRVYSPVYQYTSAVAHAGAPSYGGTVLYDDEKLPGYTCTTNSNCISGVCGALTSTVNMCKSTCTQSGECGTGTCSFGTCTCTTDANCGGGATGSCQTFLGGGKFCVNPTENDLRAAAWHARVLNGGSTNTDELYVMIGANDALTNAVGSHHSVAIASGKTNTVYGFIPYGASLSGVTDQQAVLSLVNHEVIESITDPQVNVSTAWRGNSGEAEDVCSNVPSACNVNADCWPLKTCNTSTHVCVQTCSVDADCHGASWMKCVTGGQCRDLHAYTLDPNVTMTYGDRYSDFIDSGADEYARTTTASNQANAGASACVFSSMHQESAVSRIFNGASMGVRVGYQDSNGLYAYHDLLGPSGRTLAGDPSATAAIPGRLEVFSRNTSTQDIEHAWTSLPYDGSTAVHWQTPISTPCASAIGDPEATSPQPNTILLLVRCTASGSAQLYIQRLAYASSTWTSGSWYAITPSSFTMASAPTLVAWSRLRADIFLLGTSAGVTHMWYTNTRDTTSFTGMTWYDLDTTIGGTAPGFTGDPDASSWMPGHLDAVIRDSANHIWMYTDDETGVFSTQWLRRDLGQLPAGHTVSSNPTVVGMGDFRLDVAAKDQNGVLYYWRWYDAQWGSGLPSITWSSTSQNFLTYSGVDGVTLL